MQARSEGRDRDAPGGRRRAERARRTWAGAVLVAGAIAIAGGCSAEDVTGQPEDISTLVHVDAASRCTHDSGSDTAQFHVVLKNTGGDDRTVSVTPVRRFSDGRDVGTSVEGFRMTVPGMDSAEHDLTVDAVSDDLTGCAVRLDGGDAAEIEVADAAG